MKQTPASMRDKGGATAAPRQLGRPAEWEGSPGRQPANHRRILILSPPSQVSRGSPPVWWAGLLRCVWAPAGGRRTQAVGGRRRRRHRRGLQASQGRSGGLPGSPHATVRRVLEGWMRDDSTTQLMARSHHPCQPSPQRAPQGRPALSTDSPHTFRALYTRAGLPEPQLVPVPNSKACAVPTAARGSA